MKIGLFFGSFNPIHHGHLMVASFIANHTDIQQVWLVVSPQNPHKTQSSLLNEYDRLFNVEDPSSAEGDFKSYINPHSLHTVTTAWGEPALLNDALEDRFQFLRKGYFYQDTNSTKDKLVFNRTVTLKDTWAKEQKK